VALLAPNNAVASDETPSRASHSLLHHEDDGAVSWRPCRIGDLSVGRGQTTKAASGRVNEIEGLRVPLRTDEDDLRSVRRPGWRGVAATAVAHLARPGSVRLHGVDLPQPALVEACEGDPAAPTRPGGVDLRCPTGGQLTQALPVISSEAVNVVSGMDDPSPPPQARLRARPRPLSRYNQTASAAGGRGLIRRPLVAFPAFCDETPPEG